jgi:mannose-6-phosphate isomerase-like protein (cupin superfamily)
MRLESVDSSAAKGWYVGPWNSDLPIAIGYANAAIDEPHVHSQLTEIYIVTRGTSEIRIEQKTIALQAGDLLIVEPGEAHTFLSNSLDYFHVVIHTPPYPATTPVVKTGRAPLTFGLTEATPGDTPVAASIKTIPRCAIGPLSRQPSRRVAGLR